MNTDLTLNATLYHVVITEEEATQPGVSIITVGLSRPPTASEMFSPSLSGESRQFFTIDTVTTGVWVIRTSMALNSGTYEVDVNIGYVNLGPPLEVGSLLGTAVVDVPSQSKSLVTETYY